MEITLRATERADFPIIRGWIDTRLFRVFKEPIGDDQLESLLTRYEGSRPTDLGYLAESPGGEPVGLVHAVLDWRNELAHIQQIIVSDAGHRRKGVGTVLMNHLMEICFEEHRLHRAQLFVDEDNEPALSFYDKLGFRSDGLMREATRTDEGFVSWHCMSMLTSEWGGEDVQDHG